MSWNENKYILELNKFNPDIKLITSFKILRDYVQVKDKLGIIYCSLAQTFLKSKPTIKSALDKNFAFEQLARLKHGNKYDYSLVNYINSSSKVKIICPIHGEFEQSFANHVLTGRGCQKCNHSWGSTRENWLDFTKDKNCIFYIINCYNNKENFIKFGITSKSIKERYCGLKNMPYKYDIIYEFEGMSDFIWDIEHLFHNIYKNKKYIPKLKFGGKTECYNNEIIYNLLKIVKDKHLEYILKNNNPWQKVMNFRT